MRFVEDGPDVPERLMRLHEDGQVVFFCGAGISYPAGLPGFSGLVTALFESLGETASPAEQAAINDGRFDAAIDLLERRLGYRMHVREKVRAILTPNDLTQPEAILTHRALLMLANARDGQTRLVTTNFDRLFYAVDPGLKSYVAPLLPIPKRTRWHGVVYLHGLLPDGEDISALNNLVMSSGDFGLAYLTERWASRFVAELFRGYTVCFVGYSIGDPVLRYMLDALSADRLMGETTQEMFAFGDFRIENEADTKQKWIAKGVTPILYVETEGHALLHKTLQDWSEVYRDGLTGKRAIITREAAELPSPLRDGQVSRVLWAITDPSGQPARVFADLDPAPPIEWLAVFAEPRYTQADLRMFGLSSSSQIEPKHFSLVNRPAPSRVAAWMTLSGLNDHGTQVFDEVMWHIARWLVRHLDKPEFLRWVLANGGSAHPNFCHLILDRLKKADIPAPLVKIWKLICGGFATSGHHPHFFDWKNQFEQLGWSICLRAQLRDMLRPRVQFREPFRWKEQESTEENDPNISAHTPMIKDYVDWDVTLNVGDQSRYVIDEVKKLPAWPKVAVDFLSDFTTLLRDTMELMAELEGATERNDFSYLHRPSIGDHPQNQDLHGWTVLIELCRDAWVFASHSDPGLARAELERWKLIRFPVFQRLALFAAATSPLISECEGLNILLKDSEWWLWAHETQRESFRLLVGLAPKLNADQRVELCNAILDGPPRHMYRNDLESGVWDEVVDSAVWLRLEKIQEGGVLLTPEAEKRRSEIAAAHPDWQILPDERDEFSTWMEVGWGGTWRQKVTLPRESAKLAEALAIRPVDTIRYEDDWREICQTAPQDAVSALRLLASENRWPVEVWRDALHVFSEEQLVKASWSWLEPIILKVPDETLRKLLPTVSWWVRNLTNVVPLPASDAWFSLVDRLLDCALTKEYASQGKPVTTAINHPIGQMTEAIIRWWYRMEPNADERLSEPLTIRLNRLADPTKREFVHARVIMAAHLYSLFMVDPGWTAKRLLPYFDWNGDSKEASAVWHGYLWTPRIGGALLDAFKTSFLDTAHHYNELSAEHGSNYASLLTLAALDLRSHFELSELRDAFKALPSEGLAAAAKMLSRALSGVDQQREEYWTHRVKPLVLQVWPKSASLRTGAESSAFVRLCIRAGTLFRDAVEVLLPLISKGNQLHVPVKELAESKLATHHPREALKLLSAAFDENERWPPTELKKCLEQIGMADSALRSTADFLRFKEYFERLGRH